MVKSGSTSKTRRRSSRRGVRRLLNFLVTLVLAALIIGFVSFAHHVDTLKPPAVLPKADGIVVWTGKGGGRLETAGRLLREDFGERLLISGVNSQVELTDIPALTGLSEAQAACCVDLDYAALDTRGNARETAVWAGALDYDHILLVTSSYHMPRARVEIAHEIGRIKITPVPVSADRPTAWWQDQARFRRLVGEYGKYLLVMAQGRTAPDDDEPLVLPNNVPENIPEPSGEAG